MLYALEHKKIGGAGLDLVEAESFVNKKLFNYASGNLILKPHIEFASHQSIENNTAMVFENQEDIETLKPNLTLIEKINGRGLIVIAKGKKYDFVSRFFHLQQKSKKTLLRVYPYLSFSCATTRNFKYISN